MRQQQHHSFATNPPTGCRIVLTKVAKGACTMRNALLIISQAIERLPELAVERGPLQRGELAAGDLRERGFRPPVVIERLGVCSHAASLIASLEQPSLRLVPILGECVMLGKNASELVEAFGE